MVGPPFPHSLSLDLARSGRPCHRWRGALIREDRVTAAIEELRGRTARFSKTVSESDIYLFAGISGDFARVHIDEAWCSRQPFRHRVAHGVLLMSFMSTCSTLVLDGFAGAALSLGYDRVRFTKPVHIGDTVTCTYEIVEVDPASRRTTGRIEMTNQHGETVAVATHIVKVL
jgi:3-hydroxybutyryl-CoA dehydratase